MSLSPSESCHALNNGIGLFNMYAALGFQKYQGQINIFKTFWWNEWEEADKDGGNSFVA